MTINEWTCDELVEWIASWVFYYVIPVKTGIYFNLFRSRIKYGMTKYSSRYPFGMVTSMELNKMGYYSETSRKDKFMEALGIFTAIAFVVVILFVSMARGMFAKESLAIRTLEAQGFSNIVITDHSWFAVGLRGCDGHDAARFTAKATNPAGIPTQVYVCTGVFFKGGTIRVK